MSFKEASNGSLQSTFDGEQESKPQQEEETQAVNEKSKTEEPESSNLTPLLYDELKTDKRTLLEEDEKARFCSQLIVNSDEHDDKKPNGPDEGTAPDGGWGWWCVIGCAFAHFFIGGFERSGGVLLLQLQRKFGSGSADTAWIVSLSATLRLLLGPLASALSNKFSCRAVVIAGGLIFSAGVMISAFMPKYQLLYLTYGFMAGLGKSFAYAPGLVIVGQYFKKRRSLAVGIATAGGGLGTLLLPPLIELLFEDYGYMGTFIVLSGFPLHLCVCGSLYRPLEDADKTTRKKYREKDQVELKPLKSKDVLEDDSEVKSDSGKCELLGSNVALGSDGKEKHGQLLHTSLKNIKQKFSLKSPTETKKSEHKKLIDLTLLKNSRFLTFCIGIGFLSLAFNSVLVFIPPLASTIGLNRLQGAGILSIAGLFDTIGRFASGAILNFKKISPFRMIIYNLAMFLLGFLTFTLPFVTTFVHLAIVGASYGLLTGTYTSQKSVILADILGSENLDSSFGILLCFQGIGTLLGPPVIGFLKDKTDGFDDGFYFVGCVTLLGAITLTIGNVHYWYKHSRNITENEEKNINAV